MWINTASAEEDQHHCLFSPPILHRCLFSPAHRIYITACLAPPTDSTSLPVHTHPPILHYCLFSPAHRFYIFLLITTSGKRELTLFLLKNIELIIKKNQSVCYALKYVGCQLLANHSSGCVLLSLLSSTPIQAERSDERGVKTEQNIAQYFKMLMFLM